jgi:hypothetical protein
MWMKASRKHKPHQPKMINNLVDIEPRNKVIIDILETLRSMPKRKVLVLSGRREHLSVLKNTIDENILRDITDKKLIAEEYKTSFYLGGMKTASRQYAEDHADMIFGTYDMAQEGLDIARLNTIVLVTPKKNVIQAIGRIMRRILQAGDTRPLIIDLHDKLSVFENQGNIRNIQYMNNKYTIEEYEIIDSTIVGQHRFQDILDVPDINIGEVEIEELDPNINIIENDPKLDDNDIDMSVPKIKYDNGFQTTYAFSKN